MALILLQRSPMTSFRSASDLLGDVCMMKRFFYSVRIFIAIGYYLLVAFPLVVSAAPVILQWDGNSTTPDGYNLYHRADSGSYGFGHGDNEIFIKH